MSVDVPVFLVDSSGNQVSDNVNCSPCINVVIVGAGLAFKAVAMLDSGAAAIYADPDVIRQTDLPTIGHDTFHGVGHSQTTTIHDGLFWIDGLPDLKVQVQQAPLRSAGRPYDIILGRSFLTMFDFGFDLKTRAWKLVLPGMQRAENSNRPVL